MKIRQQFFLLLAALWLSGCSHHSLNERISAAESLAFQNEFARLDIQTKRLQIAAFVKPSYFGKTLRIYIEGDGFAWLTRHRPSNNPTPIDPIGLKLAAIDAYNVAYLARPCQYFEKLPSYCETSYWTDAQFSREVIDEMNKAVDQLKSLAKAERVELIGYSGGGTVAALIAAHRSDVAKLVTVAANLDHQAWSKYHKLSELNKSLNPPDFRKELLGVPQIHFIGEKDQVVPIDIYQSFRKDFAASKAMDFRVVPGMEHHCCWDKEWPRLLKTFE